MTPAPQEWARIHTDESGKKKKEIQWKDEISWMKERQNARMKIKDNEDV